MAHEWKIRVMKTVSPGTKEILRGRIRQHELAQQLERPCALAVMHGDVCDMIFASDLAQKAADVEVFEIGGSCPQPHDLPWHLGRRIGRGSGGAAHSRGNVSAASFLHKFLKMSGFGQCGGFVHCPGKKKVL